MITKMKYVFSVLLMIWIPSAQIHAQINDDIPDFNIAVPSASIAIDATNFPDENFRNYLLSQDYGQDALLTEEEIEGVTEINVSEKEIADLTGIELFTALTSLNCDFNQLTSLDVSKNVALMQLYCGCNQLTSLDVSKNTALQFLECAYNQLTSLDVTNNVALRDFECYRNQLTSLDVSKNTALQRLYCWNNQLTSLDLSKNVALQSLVCGSNPLTSLDVSKNVALTWLSCSDNQLTSLDLSKNVALQSLDCGSNPLTSLDVSKNVALETLWCSGNQLTSLDLTTNDELTEVYCYNNQIKDTAMDVLISSLPTVASGNLYAMNPLESGEGNKITPAQVAAANAKGWKVFKYQYRHGWVEMSDEEPPAGIAIDATNFPDYNFRAWLLRQDYGQDALLTEEEIAGITEIDVANNEIADLTGIELFTSLTLLKCAYNHLSSLDVTKNVALQTLYCFNNRLTFLDVSKNVALKTLYCYDNQLTSLDVSKNVELQELYCYFNQLTSLDVTKNVALQTLYCFFNELTSLDLSKNVALQSLDCGSNRLTSLDLTNNDALTKVYCSYNQLKSLILPNNDVLTTVNCPKNWIMNTAMDKLISSLPTVASGNLYAMNPLESGEGNKITPAQVAAANAKGWKVFQKDAETGEWVEMVGAVPPTDTAIDATNFPDENFRAWLLSQDYGQDALLTQEEIAGITEIGISDKDIADLTGIELFANLTYLDCSYNQLTSLDVSKNVALQRLHCDHNQLTSLDLSKNVWFEWLVCDNNQLTSLDVSKNVELYVLRCPNNQLTSLDVSKNTALQVLLCDGNQLTSLDVTKNDDLMYLYCSSNQLTSLDVSKNVKLGYLSCGSNQLTSLDVSKNVKLWYLLCGSNQLTSLDVSKNVKLELLACESNQLTSLDVSKNVALTGLGCYGNQIKDIRMDELISSLPSVDAGEFHAIDPSVSQEGNVITPAQVAAANAKGWKVFRWDDEAETWVEMSSEVPDGIQSTDKGSLTVDDAVIYNLSGQRISKPQRGVNIINGKKMVVK